MFKSLSKAWFVMLSFMVRLTNNTTEWTSYMKDKEGGVIVEDKVGDFYQELIAKCMWWIKLRMVATEDLTSKDHLTNQALHTVL